MRKIIDTAFLSAGLMLLILSGVCFVLSSRKLTYLEYRWSDQVRTVRVNWSGQMVDALSYSDEDGNVPYEIMESVTLDIRPQRPIPGTAYLCDRSGKVLAEIRANVSENKEDASSSTGVLFHVPFLKRPFDARGCYFVFCLSDGKPMSLSDIASFTFSGGAKESFWRKLAAFGIVFSGVCLLRIIYLLLRGGSVYKDSLLMAMVVTALSFAVMSVMASELNSTIMDENDNIIAGMLQTLRGTVLYKDYISQHMPFVYWLCGLFSLQGAASVGQFRLLFAFTVSFVLGLTYFRHRNRDFRRAIAFFAVCSIPAAFTFIVYNAGQVLSDNVQAVAMTVLFLELMAYYEDHEMKPGRCLVISACIFAAVGSAFLSVYAVFACMIAFAAEEIRYHISCRNQPDNLRKTSFYIKRYAILVICIILPWIPALSYLAARGALQDAYDMAFRFNVEVYAAYGLPGGNLLEPLYSGILNCVNLVRESWLGLQTGTAIYARVIESGMLLLAALLLIFGMIRRGLIQTLGIFFFIETQATRQAVQFHSIMLWYVVLMFILMELPGMRSQDSRDAERRRNRASVILPVVYSIVILAVFGLPFLRFTQAVVRYRITPVPAVEMTAVNMTEPEEEMFVECGMLESDYIFYKGRYPATRLCWTLPWYYDWYGKETVGTLRKKKPKVLIYKTDPVVWGIGGFAKEMDELVLKEYERVGEMDLFKRSFAES